MAERVDVLIAGSGFGGAITAFRLAEAYSAAGSDPRSVVVLERGRRFAHTDFEQSMHIDHLAKVYTLIQGQGAQVVTAQGVGGGSNLYLAASLRSPRETFERRDHRPGDGSGPRRMWPQNLSRASLDPFYARAEAGLRVNRPSWDRVSRSGGLWAATLANAGHTCDRVPLAISPTRCMEAKWCHTGCVFGAKNTLPTNYLGAAETLGVQVRPLIEVQSVRQSSARPYRYLVTALGPGGASLEYECKVLVLSTGAMGTAPILMRSRNDLPALSDQLGLHLGMNGDHVAAIEYDPKKVTSVLGLPGYRDFHRGKPITTMTYDFWVGRGGHEHDGTRFNLQEIFLSALTNVLYDDGRDPGGDPSWWGLQKKRAVANWANRIELLAMVEDTNDGRFFAVPPQGGAARPNDGPLAVGLFDYTMSEQSLRVREVADATMARIASRRGLGRFMRLTETDGVYASHPLGGCRMADTPALGVVDDGGAVFGYEGLYCIDSSIIPTSLGVNPSLTIAAVSERAAERLVRRGTDFGLPLRASVEPRIPREEVGPRVVPPASALRFAPKRKPKRRPKRRRTARPR